MGIPCLLSTYGSGYSINTFWRATFLRWFSRKEYVHLISFSFLNVILHMQSAIRSTLHTNARYFSLIKSPTPLNLVKLVDEFCFLTIFQAKFLQLIFLLPQYRECGNRCSLDHFFPWFSSKKCLIGVCLVKLHKNLSLLLNLFWGYATLYSKIIPQLSPIYYPIHCHGNCFVEVVNILI